MVGVSKATLSRWESGDRWPGHERLAEAAKAVGATDREVIAIKSEGPMLADVERTPAAIQEQIRILRDSIPIGTSKARDIEFIGLDARIANREGGDARRMRLELRSAYVEWLGWWYRDTEAGALAVKLLPALQRDPNSSVWGRILRACANYASEYKNDPEAAIDLLTEASAHLKGAPSEGFVLRELAGLMAGLGETCRSRDMIQRAREATNGEEKPEIHLYCCSMIEAVTWSADGRHDQAIQSLPDYAVIDPYLRQASAIGRAEVFRQAGFEDDARAQLETAVAEALSKGLNHFAAGLNKRLLTGG
jgi:transcriptional regulator with XRE-family HTH domain